MRFFLGNLKISKTKDNNKSILGTEKSGQSETIDLAQNERINEIKEIIGPVINELYKTHYLKLKINQVRNQ